MKHKKSLALLAAGLAAALIITPSVCAVVYFLRSVSRQLEMTARQSVSLSLDQFSDAAMQTMSAVRNCVYLLTTNEEVRQLMMSGEPSSLQRGQVEDQIGQILMHSSAWDSSGLRGVYLFETENDYFTMLRDGIYSGTAQRVTSVYARAHDVNSMRTLVTYPDLPGYAYCITDYNDLDTMRPVGKMIFEIKFSLLAGAEYMNSLYPGAAMFLTGRDGTLLFSSRADKTDRAFLPLITAPHDAQPRTLTADGESYFHAGRTISDFELRLDVFIPSDQILYTVRQTVYFYLVLTGVVLLITLVLGAAGYALLVKPLRGMVVKINQMADGDLTARMDPTPYRETDFISTAFNRMGRELESLFAEVYEQGLLLRDAEFDLLQSQISPHFIFNVLESINMRCIETGQTEVCHIVTNLAELLRANIAHKNEPKITIRHELRYVTYYLELQKLRFTDKLAFSIDVEDDDMLELYLPKLTIQPLVENAVVHGIENRRAGGTVSVRIWEEDCLYIRVSDDGVGFDPGETGRAESRHNHIALCNIRRRIELLYGTRYGMQIESTIGVGTVITLTIPRDRGTLC